jgi:Calcineurin-like phosphoesterase
MSVFRLFVSLSIMLVHVNGWFVPFHGGCVRAQYEVLSLCHDIRVFGVFSRQEAAHRYGAFQVHLSSSSSDGPEASTTGSGSSSRGSNKRRNRTPLENDIARKLSMSKDRAISELSQPMTGSENQKSASGGKDPPSRRTTRQRNNQGSNNTVYDRTARRANGVRRVSKRTRTNANATAMPGGRPTENTRTKEPSPLLPSSPLQSGGPPLPTNKRKYSSSADSGGMARRTTIPQKKSSIGPSPLPETSRSVPPMVSDGQRSLSSRTTRVASSNGRRSYTTQMKGSNPPDDSVSKNAPRYSSLLPPPLLHSALDEDDDDNHNAYGDGDDMGSSIAHDISAWEQFLDAGASANLDQTGLRPRSAAVPTSSLLPDALSDAESSGVQERLPSIQDLFPPGLTASNLSSQRTNSRSYPSKLTSIVPTKSGSATGETPIQRPLTLDGVLPVSELFYRSSQAARAEYDEDEEHDDEELPFSAEQSDAIMSDENKVLVRQNLAKHTSPPTQPAVVAASKRTPIDKSSRKMIRRGMDMLVGGVPVYADPPQRSVQLMYEEPSSSERDWASCISLNTRAFGPLLHVGSIAKVQDFERGLFCEYFCQSAIKWDICPKDLQSIVKSHLKSKSTPSLPNKSIVGAAMANSPKQPKALPNLSEPGLLLRMVLAERWLGIGVPRERLAIVEGTPAKSMPESLPKISKGFGTAKAPKQPKKLPRMSEVKDPGLLITAELGFVIGVPRGDLEMGDGGSDGGIFRSVCSRALTSLIARTEDYVASEKESIKVHILKLFMTETENGYTKVTLVFSASADSPSREITEARAKRIETYFKQEMDASNIALAVAAVAKEETRWPAALRDRIVEECLFPADTLDESAEAQVPWNKPSDGDSSGNAVAQSNVVDVAEETLYRGEGDRLSIFNDYSAANAHHAPYSGEIGLRLVHAVTERAKQRHPRVIAIGDVHGCIDELQDLLRQCDYRPGDLVIFLGDLVCKGPDSISVVQMGREIGAIGVRGNHDFEVLRWHNAMKSGVEPPVFGSEHYHIASCLSVADMNWLDSLPWYISSKDLSALFVHAGFVSGIRLAKQNPRLMMNMRSVLPDGTVTSKFFNNWPWARLWDGPQTVLFGHDADRGLQQYEHAIGLDTGCVYGGRLTACILPEKRLVSVSARREYFKYRRKHYD